jgi:hypothetical protein
MAFASGSEHSLYYVPESTIGTTPATPPFKTFRHTGTTLALTKDTIQSEELGGRQIKCFRHGNKQVSGSNDYELSYGDFDDMLEAVTLGSWTTNVLKAGAIRRGFTFERYFADIDERIRYTGCEVNEVTMTIAPNAVVTGSFSIVGVDQDPVNTMIAGSTYAAPSVQCPFDSFSGIVTEGGVTSGIVTQIELSLVNGIEPQFVVGSAAVAGKSLGKSNATGTATIQFVDMVALNKFVNETESAITVNLVAEDGSELLIDIPKIKYTGGQPDVSGEGIITLAMPFQALYDTTAESNIVFTRTPI